MKNPNKIAKQNKQSNSIYQQPLRQGRAIFNLKFNLLKLSIITTFASVLLIYSGKVPAEKVEAAQGIICRMVLLTFKVTKHISSTILNKHKETGFLRTESIIISLSDLQETRFLVHVQDMNKDANENFDDENKDE
ncbi:MAG: hypothetical protein AAFV71_21960 [Cyanobacteria bacterium J06633_8]